MKDERCFNAQKPWKRFIVILAGPLMNFVLAFLIALGIALGWGVVDESRVIVAAVNENGPAQAAGVLAGDEFLYVDGVRIDSMDTLTATVSAADSSRMEAVVLRDGEERTLVFTNLYNEAEGRNFMNVSIAHPQVKASFAMAVKDGAAFCYEMAGLVFKSLGMLFTGEAVLKDMAGPVGIIQILGQAADSGLYYLLNLSVMLSVNLGIVNLFPIPALDGGRLLFILIEWVRGKPVPPEKEGVVHLIGFGLLMALVVVITFNDVMRLIRG